MAADGANEIVHAEILVIGAGAAGLATAACLARRGPQSLVIERAGSVAASWQAHYRRLHLHTVSSHSALPFLPFPPRTPRYVPRQQVVEYLQAYARHFRIEPEFGQEVREIVSRGGAWETVAASGRRWRSSHVVVATGANQEPNLLAFQGQASYRGGSCTAATTATLRHSPASGCWWSAWATPAPRSRWTSPSRARSRRSPCARR